MDQLQPEKLSLTSENVTARRVAELRALLPEAFAEDRLDLDKLKAALGDIDDPKGGREPYGLTWPGKVDAIRAIQSPSVGTLKPDRDRSVDFDATGNVFIEGDNLEVLKLLQKSYYGRVKMIYIDPPYNTGKEFIYPDKFNEGLRDYLEFSKQVRDGVRLASNAETEGRFHSKWLSMMYPRLFLARQLLREDGAVYVSIDDNEVDTLRLLMDEIFGEDRFIAQVTVVNNLKGRNDKKHIATTHEYLLIYGKREFNSLGLPLTEKQLAAFNQVDEHGERFQWRDLRKRGGADTRKLRQKMYFPLFANPESGAVALEASKEFSQPIYPVRKDGTDGCWRWGLKKVRGNLAIMRASQVAKSGKWNVSYSIPLKVNGVVRRTKPKSTWIGSQFSTDSGTKRLRRLVKGVDAKKLTPKPVGLIRTILQQSTADGDICLDLFAGTGTLGEVVLKMNAEAPAKRQFILIQLPEPTPYPDFATVADVALHRLDEASREFSSNLFANQAAGLANDLGRKVFKLDSSNFRIWDNEEAGTEGAKGAKSLMEYMAEHVNNVLPGASEESILFEILIKSGTDLSARREAVDLGVGKRIWRINGGALIVCLADNVTLDTMRGIAALDPKPRRVICLDRCFAGDDALKTNTVLEMRSHEIHFLTV